MLAVCMCVLSCVQLFAVPLTAAHQSPLPIEFPRHKYWSGLQFPPPDDVRCRFVIYGLSYVEVCFLYAHFLESFIINGCWILSKTFSPSIVMIMWLLFFSLLMWCVTSIDLWILKYICIPGINPAWLWCMILLMCYWIGLLVYCWGFLSVCSSLTLLVVFLLGVFFSGFGTRVMVASMNLGVLFPLKFFEVTWEE